MNKYLLGYLTGSAIFFIIVGIAIKKYNKK